MTTYKPNDNYYSVFETQRFDTGNATDADYAPYGYAYYNGVYDGSFFLTIENLETGLYKATGTVPSGYVSGDKVDIQIRASVNSVDGKSVIDDLSFYF